MAVAPGRHPLRALATADGASPSLAPAWAEVGRAADPVGARWKAIDVIATEWQWTALPADYAHVIAASGLLPQIARVVVLGGAYVASLRGRCASAAHAAAPRPSFRRAPLPRRRGHPLSQPIVAARRRGDC